MRAVWNRVVDDADAFPQIEELAPEQAEPFFASQTYTAVAEKDGEIAGLYILHPNNIGRCRTIANASYAVRSDLRGCGIGELLVRDSLEQAARSGFHVLQFNAVVRSNTAAVHLYEKLGFTRLGSIPACYEKKDGSYEDLILFFHPL